MATTPTLWRGLGQVNTTDGGFAQTESDIVALPDGGYLIVWEDRTLPGDTDMFGQRYDATGAKSGGEIPIEIVTDSQTAPALAVLDTGDVLVAFTDNFGGFFDTWTSRFDANLNHYPDASSDHNILRDSIERWGWDSSDPAIAALGDGQYAVTYTIRAEPLEPEDLDVYAQVINADGSQGALVAISTDAVNADSAEVATLSNGTFVTVHRYESDPETQPGDHDILFQINNADGTTVTGAGVAGATGTDDAYEPDVAALTGGGFAVVWTDAAGDGAESGIRTTVYDSAGGVIASDILVNATTQGDQNEAVVVGLSDGGFLVAWEDDEAGVTRARAFDATGDAVGDEVDIFNGTGGGGPNAALLADGRVAFAFDRFDGADWDVVTSIWDPTGNAEPPPAVPTNGNDTLTALPEGSTINGLGGNDTLIGLGGDDIFNGAKGRDTLMGGSGADILDGGKDKDSLFGGGGADVFVFSATAVPRHGVGRDVIEDFSQGDGDLINISGIDANSKKGGDQKFKWIGTKKFHDKNGELHIKNKSSKTIVEGDVDGDGKADFKIVVHGDHPLQDDFIL